MPSVLTFVDPDPVLAPCGKVLGGNWCPALTYLSSHAPVQMYFTSACLMYLSCACSDPSFPTLCSGLSVLVALHSSVVRDSIISVK